MIATTNHSGGQPRGRGGKGSGLRKKISGDGGKDSELGQV